MATIRVLLVCANPRGTDPLRTGEEDRTLRESVHLSEHRSQIEVETLHATTVDDLRRALLRSRFDLVHFSGHGTQSGLCFEDSAGRLMVPSSEALAELLARHGINTAVLNACYSLSVGRLAAIGVEHTIASAGPVADPAAIEFTRGFYDALGAGRAVPDAYEEGLSSARLKHLEPDMILLRRGEEHVATSQPAEPDGGRDGGSEFLVGVAVDTSGSMQANIQNRSGPELSRLETVYESLRGLAKSAGEALTSDGSDAVGDMHLFVYGYGLRIGNGVADLLALLKAAETLNIDAEIEARRRRYESEARRSASNLGGLAQLARSHGLGSLVDAAETAAVENIKDRIAAEVAHLVVNTAAELGDVTVTPNELAELLGQEGGRTSFRDLEELVYGATPMAEAARAITARFEREASDTPRPQERLLVLISDGRPTDGDPSPTFAQLRDSGVTIISCFVTSDDVLDPRSLVGAADPSWDQGTHLMFDTASPVTDSPEVARYLLGLGWSVAPDARLFVQANHSEILEEFIRGAQGRVEGPAGLLLPRGR